MMERVNEEQQALIVIVVVKSKGDGIYNDVLTGNRRSRWSQEGVKKSIYTDGTHTSRLTWQY